MGTDMEFAARISLLQAVLEHMIADQLSRHPDGAAVVAVLKECVMRSITDQGQFTRPVNDEEREDYVVNVRAIGESFFKRTDEFRAQLATIRQPPT